MPENIDAYIHRIGRTGRVDETGEAFTFVTSEDTAMVHDIEKVLNKTLERCTLQGFDYKVPALDKEFGHSPNQMRRSPVRRQGMRNKYQFSLSRSS
jgi:ATP-dependent RNA helicase RhlE